MRLVISPASVEDLSYDIDDLDRRIGDVNGDFINLDGGGPIEYALRVARLRGSLGLLDAGCGTSLSLLGFKEQVSRRAPIDADAVRAVGVSLADYTDLLWAWKDRANVRSGYVQMRIGNLATIGLEPEQFDVAYSYEVLPHNAQIAPVIANVMPSLRAGGAYYFDTLVEQQEELDALNAQLDPTQWQLLSETITRQTKWEQGSRVMNRLQHLPAAGQGHTVLL